MERIYTPKYLKHLNYNQIQLQSMLKELCQVFNMVSLSDQDDVKREYIDMLEKVIKFNMQQGYKNVHSYDITMTCYNSLENLCTPLHATDVEDIIYLIFCRTFDLHLCTHKRFNFALPENQKHCDGIADFFIYMLDSFTEQTKNVLIR